uniref:C2H2-type domain-containing protein n=1 Tax=Lepeophtheirus salmonis TaxID=72036 RepID=A0A0K2U2U6_LEPSM
MKQEKAAQSPSNNYTCSICGFSASRLNVIILHNKSHANQSASSGRQSGSPMMQRSKNGLETSSRHTQEPKKLSKKSTVAQVKKTSQDKKSPPKKPRMTKKLKEIKAKEEEEMKVERRNKILNDWSDDEDNEGGNKIDDPAVEENWDDEEMEIYMGDDNLHQNCSEDENEAIECDNKDTINSKSTKTPGGSMSPKNNDLPDDTTEQHNPSQNTNKSSKTKEHESVNKLCVEGDEVQDKTDTTMGSKGAQEEHQMSQSKLESDGAEIINEPSTKMLKDSELDEGTFKVSGKYDKIDSSDNADDKSEDSSDSSDNTKHHIVSLSSSTEETVKDSQVTPSETDFSELNSKNVQTPHSQLNDEEEISNSVSSELDKKLDYEPVQDEETFKYSAGNSKSCEYERPVKESSVCNNVNSSSDLKIIEEAESTNSKENHKDVTTSESFEEKKVLKNGSYDETESPSSSNSNIDAPDVIDINKVLEETRVPSLPKDLKDISEVEDSRKKSLCVKVMQPTSNLTDPWDVQDEFMKDQEGASKKRKEADEDAVSTTTPSEKNEKNQPDSSSRNENSSEEQSKNELDGKTIMAVIPNGNESTLAVVGEDNKVFAITGDCKGELTSTQQLLQGEEETYILLVDDGSGTVDSLNSQTLYIDPSSLASGDYSNMVLMTSSTSTGSTKESSNKDILALAIQQQQIVTTVDTTGGVVVVPGIASSSGLTKIPLISTQATPSAPIMTPDVLSSQVPGVPDSTSPNLSSKNIQKSV